MLVLAIIGAVIKRPPFFRNSEKWVVTLFRKGNCQPCTELAVSVDRLADLFGHQDDILFYSIDVDEYLKFAMEKDIVGVPTIVINRGDDGEVFRYKGDFTIASIAEFIENVTSLDYNSGLVIPRERVPFSDQWHEILAGNCVAVPVGRQFPVVNSFYRAMDVVGNMSNFVALALTARGHARASLRAPFIPVIMLSRFDRQLALALNENTSEAIYKFCTSLEVEAWIQKLDEVLVRNVPSTISTILGDVDLDLDDLELGRRATEMSLEEIERETDRVREEMLSDELVMRGTAVMLSIIALNKSQHSL